MHNKLSLPIIHLAASSTKDLVSRLSDQDYKNHPELQSVVSHKKHYSLNYISNTVPQIKSTKEVTDNHKKKVIANINSFQQMYFNYCSNESQLISQFNKSRHDNVKFGFHYNRLFNNKNSKLNRLKNGHSLNEILNKYDTLRYKLPKTDINENNLFKDNFLLLMNADLKKYYLFNKSKENQEKSIHFLQKLEEEMIMKSSTNDQQEKENNRRVQFRLNEEEKKIIAKLKREIKENEREIEKINDTMKSIENYDDFFVTKNKFNFRKSKSTITDIKPKQISIESGNNGEYTSERTSRQRNSFVNKRMIIFKNNKNIPSLYSNNNNGMNINKNSSATDRKSRFAINSSRLEKKYDEIKEQKLRNVQEDALQTYISEHKKTNSEDNTSKGIYQQFNRIKNQMLSKDFLKENIMLKLRHNCFSQSNINTNNVNHINKEDKEKQMSNKRIEDSLLLSEKMIIKNAYETAKE